MAINSQHFLTFEIISNYYQSAIYIYPQITTQNQKDEYSNFRGKEQQELDYPN